MSDDLEREPAPLIPGRPRILVPPCWCADLREAGGPAAVRCPPCLAADVTALRAQLAQRVRAACWAFARRASGLSFAALARPASAASCWRGLCPETYAVR